MVSILFHLKDSFLGVILHHPASCSAKLPDPRGGVDDDILFSISSHRLQEGAFLMVAEQDLPVDRTECCQESFHSNAPLFSSRSVTYLVTGSWPPEQCQAGFHLVEWVLNSVT